MNATNSESSFLMKAGILYLIISQFMTIYFWWDWAQDNGFWSTIVIGPIVAEFKGLLWIFFIQ